MAAEALLLKAVDYTLDFLKIRESRSEKEKELKFSALRLFRIAILSTRSYLADRRDHITDRNREKEAELSKAWNDVAIEIKKIETDQAQELYRVCFRKADYWSDPTSWETNKTDDIDISLKRVDRELSELLG